MNIARIMSKVLNRPLMLEPAAAEVVYSVLANKAGIQPLLKEWDMPTPSASRFAGRWVEDSAGVPFKMVGNTAIVSVVGELANRGAWIGANSGLVTYEGIEAQLTSAAKYVGATSILLDVESPGGEAVGAMEIAATVRKINAEKPVFAFVNGMAASAGYALVSGARRIFTVPSGISGSIGVVLLHMDYSEKLAEEGIKPTLIHAGANKVDGNPFEPLSDAVKADLQGEVMKFYDLFVQTVAAGRPGLNAKAIRDTEARTFIGQDAVDAGLVDAVATFEDAMSEITRAVGRSTVSKGASMTDKSGEPAASNAGFTQADIDAAATAATSRLTTIVTAEGIAGDANRTKVATKMAATSTMSAADIVAFVIDSVPAASAVPPISERADASGMDSLPAANKEPTKTNSKLNPASIYATRAKARAERGLAH